jgi:hypothetical protein
VTRWIALPVLAALATAAGNAQAVAVAYPTGGYESLSAEEVVVVWDEGGHVEHLVLRPVFDGDAPGFGLLVPTPSVPDVARVDDAVVDRVARTTPPPPPGGTLDGFEAASLPTTGADLLGDWLRAHHFADRPALRTWALPYLRKGWVITALTFTPRAAPATADRAVVRAPAVRLSFATDAPFFPYTEPQTDIEAQAAFARRHHAPRAARDVGVWVVAGDEMRASGNFLQGLPEESSARVAGTDLATALGDTTAWKLEPRARPFWRVTYMHEALEQRVAFEDLRFVAPDDTGAAAPKAKHGSRKPRPAHVLLALVALGVLAAAAAAAAREAAR